MWTRRELKQNAKEVLKRTYWLSFAVVLVGELIANVGSTYKIVSNYSKLFGNELPTTVIFSGTAFTLLFMIFLALPLLAGKCYFFMRSRQYDTEFTDMFSGFTNGNYLHTIGTLLLKQIFIFLWSLLLFIPGIIKTYEYYFVPYIIMENPQISRKRAFELSRQMTNGFKWNIFVLELSFIGWSLLGLLLCGIGILFVAPYIEATKAELYAAQRAHVLQEGVTDEAELCGFSKNIF